MAEKKEAAKADARGNIPRGVWLKCKACREVLFAAELERNLMVCPKCDFHFPISARKRIEILVDEGTFAQYDADVTPVDFLGFVDRKPYADRLTESAQKIGCPDAMITGLAAIEGIPVSLAAMEFGFIGGSMGSVVGELVARTFERGVEHRRPVIIAPASGGARMMEGIVSLMQMAKTQAAYKTLQEAALPYIVIISDPTTAGVMASFASTGDVIVSEPKALMGFAGPRVIKETIRQDLPPGFQRAEFQLEHGFVDIITHRRDVRRIVAELLRLLSPRA